MKKLYIFYEVVWLKAIQFIQQTVNRLCKNMLVKCIIHFECTSSG